MSMNALTIQEAAQSTITVIKTGEKVASSVLDKVAAHMDAVEKLKDGSLSGSQKRAFVIEYAIKEIAEVFANVGFWLPLIMSFIDAAKAAYNAWKAFYKSF